MSIRVFSKVIVIVCACAFPTLGVAAERVAVVMPDDPMMEEYAAAYHLVYHLGKIEGVEARVLLESGLEPSFWRRAADRFRGRDGFYEDIDVRIHLKDAGRRMKEEVVGGVLETGSVGEYELRKVGDVVHIQGKGVGMIHAAYGFLQDHVGFRWYLPGELGEVVPAIALNALADFESTSCTAFRSRQFSGLRTRQSRDWHLMNRMEPAGGVNRVYRFHHNVRQIFTPNLFEEHPEIFPLWDGVRYRPPENDPNWQPCFSHPKTAAIAAQAAREFFDANPRAISFSVGMNDGNRICECDLCQGLVDHGRSFRDKPDYSDLIFTFTNRVAEALEETHPDKYIGCLAYHWAENTPSFPVHSRVIPYLTADRAQWIDERFRSEDEDLMRRWIEAGPEIVGIYDYYYGGAYVIPRVFNRVMADSIRHAYDSGIQGFYAELYPRWSLDGPKAWLAARLLWDPAAEVEVLLEDYYRTFFGPAADAMREYFEFVEERWESQKGVPYWLRYYFQIAQMELYPPEFCAEARGYLDAAELAAGDRSPYRERVDLFSEGFRITELYSRYYHFIRDLPAGRELSSDDGWRFLVDLMLYADHFEELRHWKNTVFETNPLHRETSELRFYERIGFKPEMRLTAWVAPLLDWGESNGTEGLVSEVLDRLETVFPAARIDVAREIESLPTGRNLAVNGNFTFDRYLSNEEDYLAVRGRPPAEWDLWWRPGTASGFFLTAEEAARGPLALRAEGSVEEFAYLNVEVDPEALYRFTAHARGHISNGGRIRIELFWWDEQGRLLRDDFRFVDQLPEGAHDTWSRLEVVGRPPADAVTLMANLVVEHQDDGDWAMFDSVRLEEWR